ncbi:DMT family transporter [Tychonema sp. BBK16]|uniref:DMT family transporter n=1 Tax=Tychonema sp. BBK16 TaxID=2699888 RepID=UPI0038D2C8B2
MQAFLKYTKNTLIPPTTTLSLIGVAIIWGGTFIAGRQLADSSPPLLSAFIRFFIASIVLAFCLPPQQKNLNVAQKIRVLFLGTFGIFLYNICFFYGLQHISASRASLIVSINPAVIALSAFLFMQEKLSPMKLAGIAACLIGASAIILNKDPSAIIANSTTWKGDLLILGCVISWVTYSVFSRPLIREIGSINAVFYSVLTGTILLFFAVLINGDLTLKNLLNLGIVQIICLFFLGIFGSALAYVWYYKGIEKIGATRAGVYIALVPLFAVIFGQVILHEPINIIMIIGGLLVLIGIVLCNKG